MGLIKEPKNIDFFVIDKIWSTKEKSEFSAFIELQKAKQKKPENSVRTKHKTTVKQ